MFYETALLFLASQISSYCNGLGQNKQPPIPHLTILHLLNLRKLQDWKYTLALLALPGAVFFEYALIQLVKACILARSVTVNIAFVIAHEKRIHKK